MNHRFRRFGCRALLATLALVAGRSSLGLAQTSRITGTVTDQGSGKPLEAARVVVTGTSIIETTSQEGKYTVRNLAAGSYQVRLLRIGYQPKVLPVTVAAGETATLDFALAPAPVQLDEIVTTATGEQRKLEVANAVSTIDVASVAAEQPITQFGDLLSGRAAGVQVLKSGGTTGTGTRIRIRGSNSLSLSNEPLYYIDGVRMESSASSLSLDVGGGIGGGATSRINDLNPDDIESIEIVKGPAAATLYGIQASNGVVRITTKRGSAGKAKWNTYVEDGGVHDGNTYPLNYFGFDASGGTCALQDVVDGTCTQASILKYSPLQNKSTRPFKTGLRQSYGASVSGGNDFATYFFSADYENEQGVLRLPQFEEDSIRNTRGDVRASQIRPNALSKLSIRTNATANVSKNADIAVSLGYVTSNTRLIENDNSSLTITGSAETSNFTPDINRGWFFIPAELFAELNNTGVGRFTSGITANWRPATWLTTRATLGYDVVHRGDVQFFPNGEVADLDQNRDGVRMDNRAQVSQTSVDVAASARFKLSPSLGSKTSTGAQFFRNLDQSTFLTGRGIVAGSQSITGASEIDGRETTAESRSAGAFVEQEMSFNERLILTAALRFDDNSAFGKNFNATVYPKVSGSWLLSEEPFWHARAFNTFRLRMAYGASGQAPGPTDARLFFSPVSAQVAGKKEFGVDFGSLGNADLKPERSSEFEAGIDAGLFHDRVSLEATVYTKSTRDALVLKPVAGSLGTVAEQFFNLGRLRNQGVELALNTRIVDKPAFTWDMEISGSFTQNRVQDLGGVPPIDVGFYQRHVAGYPAGGFWSRNLTYSDANSDGIIDASEISVDSVLHFKGSALPTREFSLNNSISVFKNRLRLGTQFDYRGGHLVDNSIENYRCYVGVCRGLIDKKAPLLEQAQAQAAFTGFSNVYAFLEPGWFIKLRELSLTYYAPDAWARALGAGKLSLTLAGRNLWTITNYSGVDPEVNAFGQSNFSTSDFESQPQVRYWTARINMSF